MLFRLNSHDLNSDNKTNGAVILLSQRMNRIKAVIEKVKTVIKNRREGDYDNSMSPKVNVPNMIIVNSWPIGSREIS